MIRITPDKGFENLVAGLRFFSDNANDLLYKFAKDHANLYIDILQAGLRKANLVRPRLSEATLIIKKAKGFSRIKTPLMGMGDRDRKSMIFGVKIRKVKNGYKIAPYGKHYSKNEQKMIWAIHEYGATIMVTPRMRRFLAGVYGIYLKKDTHIIRIPARQPLRKAYNRYMKSNKKKILDGYYIEQMANAIFNSVEFQNYKNIVDHSDSKNG